MSRQAWLKVGVIILILLSCVTLILLVWSTTQDRTTPATTSTTELLPWQSEFIRGYETTLGPIEEDEIDPLLTYAVVLCAYLDQGHTFPEAWQFGVDALGMSSDQTAVVIEGAVRTKCTAYEPQLQRAVT